MYHQIFYLSVARIFIYFPKYIRKHASHALKIHIRVKSLTSGSSIQQCIQVEIQCQSMHAHVWQHDNDIPRVCSPRNVILSCFFSFHSPLVLLSNSIVMAEEVYISIDSGSSSVKTKTRLNFLLFDDTYVQNDL